MSIAIDSLFISFRHQDHSRFAEKFLHNDHFAQEFSEKSSLETFGNARSHTITL